MDLFKKEESRDYSLGGACVNVVFHILDAMEAEGVLTDACKDSEIFTKFVLKVESKDIDGWEKGIAPAEVVKLNGIYDFVHVVALDILMASRIKASRKN